MRIIKWKIFEEMVIDTTKTIENLKAALVELEDEGFKVEVKWVKWNEILISIHNPTKYDRNVFDTTLGYVKPVNSSVIEDYIMNLVDYCDDCAITYAYRIVGVGNKTISDTSIFPENENLNYLKMLIKINNCPIE